MLSVTHSLSLLFYEVVEDLDEASGRAKTMRAETQGGIIPGAHHRVASLEVTGAEVVWVGDQM